ncbi:MAG: ferritin-like domain-containing protein [Kofleriaceae bacterium]|nr:ferritin-like domain-containing protein [Kofleriaceae bacterium]
MLADQSLTRSLVRLVAPIVWRSDRKMASKLAGFAATEAGSALDMLKAAELCDDKKLRRLFFRHAMDEARHAKMFRAHSRLLGKESDLQESEYMRSSATRQNLYQELGLVRFLAFVYQAEKRGEAHFDSLRRHFAGHPSLEKLFEEIGKDERFHVAYSKSLLKRLQDSGREKEVKQAKRSIAVQTAWASWRRAGKRIGNVLSWCVLAITYVVVVPVFALVQRITDRGAAHGWQRRRLPEGSVSEMRRQS